MDNGKLMMLRANFIGVDGIGNLRGKDKDKYGTEDGLQAQPFLLTDKNMKW